MTEFVEATGCDIQISKSAISEFETIMQQDENKGKAIRIMIAGMGCSGPQIGLALDDPNEADKVFDDNGVQILVDEGMKQQITAFEGLQIEFVNDPSYGTGFKVAFKNPPASSCGGSCSGC